MGVVGFLGLGSNLGDRLANLQAAVDALQAEPGLRVTASSRVWETKPVGGPPQPDYLNAVIRIETDLSARDLLDVARRVETRLGRIRKERWGARTMDVDVLLYDDEEVDEPDLVVPHPRMMQRAFVLLPLDMPHRPGEATQELLVDLDAARSDQRRHLSHAVTGRVVRR